MLTRFVYPKLDVFYLRTKPDLAQQLAIASPTDDGHRWFGVKDAIEAYCEEYGCRVDNVRWLVYRSATGEYETIIAENLDDWERQFNALDIEFDPIQD